MNARPTLALSLAALALLLATGTGCAASFTSIEKQPDGSYYLTQVKQGPFFVAGSTWRCMPRAETSVVCRRVGVP